MDISVLRSLEYLKIRNMLAEKTGSVMGRELVQSLLPSDDIKVVQQRLAETREAVDLLSAMPGVPLGGFRDLRQIMRRAELEAVLEPEEIAEVGSTLYACRRVKSYFQDVNFPSPILLGLAGSITVLRNLENAIEGTLDEHGNIRDDASVELLRIRREMRNIQVRIKEKLDSILRSAEYQKFFQDALVTIRGDRYVIPVKQEYRHNFPGIVHDQSASGATVFIEPMPVVNMNNDLKQLASAEKTEVERILRQLSAYIAGESAAIRQNCEILAQLDMIFAKAELAFQMKARMPVLNSKGYVCLYQARHPLIPADQVVPTDIRIGKEFHTLLITGPNTGGKTVTLKTVGLLALMCQAGLFIPAAHESELPVFHNIFADIGDEQSIEQSLSTFSAHMTNMVHILRQVSDGDLVLVDEIGAGTDPNEGAALAMSILEFFHNQGVRTIVTTHYSVLKTFAFSRTGVENASVEFDEETLRPTYRLLIGVPGSSNAFSISRRLGLDQGLINRAKELITFEHAEFETILASLEEEKRLYAGYNEEMYRLKVQLAADQEKFYQAKEEFDQGKREILQRAHDEASAVIRQARRQMEAIIDELKAKAANGDSRQRQQAIDAARKGLQQQMNGIQIADDPDELPLADADDLHSGDSVYVASLGQKGTVVSVEGGNVAVQLGMMKVNVPVKECRVPPRMRRSKSETPAVKAKPMDFRRMQNVSRQIDIRGTTVEEAELILEKYLDDALLAGLQEVLVIHGKGTGALKKGVRSYLKSHPRVQDVRIAEMGEGGDGATVIRLL